MGQAEKALCLSEQRLQPGSKCIHSSMKQKLEEMVAQQTTTVGQ